MQCYGFSQRPGYISLFMLLCLAITMTLALAHTRYIRSFTRTGYCFPVSLENQNYLQDAPVTLAGQFRPGIHTYRLGQLKVQGQLSQATTRLGQAVYMAIRIDQEAFQGQIAVLRLKIPDLEVIIRGTGDEERERKQ